MSIYQNDLISIQQLISSKPHWCGFRNTGVLVRSNNQQSTLLYPRIGLTARAGIAITNHRHNNQFGS
jgi:hypothetical protein